MARKFGREFKLEVIRMASEEGIAAREVERRLGRAGSNPPLHRTSAPARASLR